MNGGASDLQCPNVRKASDLPDLPASDLSEMPIGIGQRSDISDDTSRGRSRIVLDHAAAAEQLDAALAATVTLDRTLAAAGVASWPHDSPRRHTLVALDSLAAARGALDRITVAAGLASPYVRRDLQPNAETRAAAVAARRAALAIEAAEMDRRSGNLVRVHRRGRPGEKCGSSGEGTPYTDHGDRSPSLHEGAHEFDGSAAALAAQTPRAHHADHDDTEAEGAPTALLAAI